MIQIEVRVTCSVDKVTCLETRYLRHHLEQQCIAGNVERHTQESVSRALIQLERESSISHIELEDGMTWGQRHLINLSHIPGRNDHTARIGVCLQLIEHVLYLVDGTSVVVRP